MIKASYKCKNCGKRFFRDTSISPKKNIETLMYQMISDPESFKGDVPEYIVHKCGPTRVGKAQFTGLDNSADGYRDGE